jgi:hypothetical protein
VAVTPPRLRPAHLFSALRRNRVRYVTVGSYAAILQGVDLEMTDLDIVPEENAENRRRLVAALNDLDAKERVGEGIEPLDELVADPDSLGDVAFRTFTTPYGDLDLVLRPAGFPHGYEDLLDRVVVVSVHDEEDPSLEVEAVLADVQSVYESKRRAGRPKDVAALPAFKTIHSDQRQELRDRYREEQERRSRS